MKMNANIAIEKLISCLLFYWSDKVRPTDRYLVTPDL